MFYFLNYRPRWKLQKLSMKCTQNFSRGFNQFSSRNWRSSFHSVGILVQKKPTPETGAFIVTCNMTTQMKKKLFHQPLQHTLRFQVLAWQAVKVLPAVAQPVSFTPRHTPWKFKGLLWCPWPKLLPESIRQRAVPNSSIFNPKIINSD